MPRKVPTGQKPKTRMLRQAKGQRARFYAADGVDELFAIVTALTAEVSATNERLRSLEEALEKAKMLRPNAVEQHELSDASLRARLAEREALIERVFQVLEGLVASPQRR
jgi:chromosome segregation ATPase